MDSTLEWFGATTFRLKARGITIFLDTWLDKASVLPTYLRISDVKEADYLFISHAHFDHLPGSDRLAINTGAIVIANCEAINLLRKAGVPEKQLMPVSGGERIPLFTRHVRDKASRGVIATRPGPPGGLVFPSHEFSAFEVHVWPSLHCLMPGASYTEIPDVMNTGISYHGPGSHPYMCTIDITFGMKHGLLKLGDNVSKEHRDAGMQSFIDYVGDTKANVFSNCDGGQMMYNFLIGRKQTVLWNAHLGAYKPLMEALEPKPDVAILGIAGRGNLNGRPFEGSAAEFARDEVHWLGQPEKVIWCLHDESPIKPFSVNTQPATELVERESTCKVVDLKQNDSYSLFS